MPQQTLVKICAGFPGMNIGIRPGAPAEPAFRSSERIREYYGDIQDYVSSEGLASEGGMPCA